MFNLQYEGDLIYLPNPRFDDGWAETHEVIVKRTISNNVHTTIRKNTNRRQYRFRFNIVTEKYIQVTTWLKNYGTKLIKVESDNHNFSGYIDKQQLLRNLKRAAPVGESWSLDLVIYEKP